MPYSFGSTMTDWRPNNPTPNFNPSPVSMPPGQGPIGEASQGGSFTFTDYAAPRSPIGLPMSNPQFAYYQALGLSENDRARSKGFSHDMGLFGSRPGMDPQRLSKMAGGVDLRTGFIPHFDASAQNLSNIYGRLGSASGPVMHDKKQGYIGDDYLQGAYLALKDQMQKNRIW